MEELISIASSQRAEALAAFGLATTFALFRVGALPTALYELRQCRIQVLHWVQPGDRDALVIVSCRAALFFLVVVMMLYNFVALAQLLYVGDIFVKLSDKLPVAVADSFVDTLRAKWQEVVVGALLIGALVLAELLLSSISRPPRITEGLDWTNPMHTHLLAGADGWRGNAKAVWAERAYRLSGAGSGSAIEGWETEWAGWYSLITEFRRWSDANPK